MAEFQVTCVLFKSSRRGVQDISDFGNHVAGWIRESDVIVNNMKRLGERFFTFVNGIRAEVGLAGPAGAEYPKTVADGYSPNNLEKLPLCPPNLSRTKRS